MITTQDVSAITSAIRTSMAQDRQRRRELDAARPIGTQGLALGLTDYRKAPDPSIESRDSAVWLMTWDGCEWQRTKRLTARNTIGEALSKMSAIAKERGIDRVE